MSWEDANGVLGRGLPAACGAREAMGATLGRRRRAAPAAREAQNWPGLLRRLDLRSDHGFTLVEMLVATALGIVVLGSVLTMLTTSAQVQARDAEWAMTVQEGRTGLARMAREIRQARVVETKEGGVMSFKSVSSAKTWVTKLNCEVAQSGTSYHECLTYTAEEGKSLPTTGTTLITDVLNPTSVFTYSPSTSPNLVTMKVELPAKGTLKEAGSNFYHNRVVLENGAFMRNIDPAG